jgi:hypothetical protein
VAHCGTPIPVIIGLTRWLEERSLILARRRCRKSVAPGYTVVMATPSRRQPDISISDAGTIGLDATMIQARKGVLVP